MGWNPWNAFRTRVDEAKIMGNAEALVASGLADSGYHYVVVDDGWWLRREPNGRIRVRTTMFPSADIGGGRTSFRPYVDRLHAMGLKAGIYTDIGRNSCSQYWDPDSPNLPVGSVRQREVGTFGHQAGDARLMFRDWGFDYVKIDACGVADFTPGSPEVISGKFESLGPLIIHGNPAASNSEDVAALYAGFARVARTAAGGGGPVLSLCAWGEADVSDWAHRYGNLWRTSSDIQPRWSSMLHNFDTAEPRALFAGPGHWNDPDMLEIGNGEFDAAHLVEVRAHLSMWAILAAPLMISTDLTKAPRAIVDILGNKSVIAIDQDPAGNQGVTLTKTDAAQIIVKTLASPGSKAVAMINRSNQPISLTTDLRDLHFSSTAPARVRNVWTGQDLMPSDGRITAHLAPHETLLLRIDGTRDDPGMLYLAEMPARVHVIVDGYKPKDRGPEGAWVPARIGYFPSGAPVLSEGARDSSAIGVSAGTRLAVDLNGEFDRFRSGLVGAGGKGFSAYLDGKRILLKPVQTTDGREVDLNVRGARRLALLAPDAGATSTVFAWGQARLIRSAHRARTRAGSIQRKLNPARRDRS